jgi:uncharacterized membrane protein
MNWVQFVVQWLHVLLGIIWFGTVLYNALILIPAIATMPLGRQRELGRVLGPQAEKVITPVAMAVIALGVVRGTLFGPIKGPADLATAYGITWLVALAFAIGAYFWGGRVVGAALERMNAVPEAEATDREGKPTPRLAATVEDVKRKMVLELGFFAVIFTCMILMRFGL